MARRRDSASVAPRAGGYTLIELLTVIMIIAVLMGIGAGVLSKIGQRNALEAETSAVRAILRRARNAAREERAPATVELDPVANEVRAQTRETLVLFRFESEQLSGLTGTLTFGEDDAEDDPSKKHRKDEPVEFDVRGSFGVSGHSWGCEPTDGKVGSGIVCDRPGSCVMVPDRPSLGALEGIAVEAWVRPVRLEDRIPKKTSTDPLPRGTDQRIKGAGAPPCPTPPRSLDHWQRHDDDPPLFTVVRKGRAFEVAVTAGYAVQLAVTGTTKGVETTYVARSSDGVLRADKWSKLLLVFDGRELVAQVDGIRRRLEPVKGSPDVPPAQLVRDRAPLLISDPDPSRAFVGLVDEVKVQAVIRSERHEIPINVALLSAVTAITFEPSGQLDPLRHGEPIVIWLADSDEAVSLRDARPDPKTLAKPAPGADDPAARGFADPVAVAKLGGVAGRAGDSHARSITVELTGNVSEERGAASPGAGAPGVGVPGAATPPGPPK